MSKATVVDVIGEGQYAVRLEYDTSNLDSVVAALQQQLIDLTQPILDAQVELIDLQNERDALAAALDDAIEAYTTAIQTDPATADIVPVIAATKALATAVTAVDVQSLKVQRLQSQRLSIAARKTTLENNSGAQQPEAGSLVWCADYVTDISVGAVVPLAIVPGELSGATWTILPREHPDEWALEWTREDFGQMVPRLSMTPEATFYNWAMLPGWQRWMPTVRHATIESIDRDNDTCSVAINAARSSVDIYPYTNGLSVNLAESTITRLTNVPIRYMDCNSQVFLEGDEVIVRFKDVSKRTPSSNWSSPEVVGFVREPRSCSFVTLQYAADPGLELSGNTDQEVPVGGDGTEVCAFVVGVEDHTGTLRPDLTFYTGWSDGNPGSCRTDEDVTVSVLYRAGAVNFPAYMLLQVQPSDDEGNSAANCPATVSGPDSLNETRAFTGDTICENPGAARRNPRIGYTRLRAILPSLDSGDFLGFDFPDAFVLSPAETGDSRYSVVLYEPPDVTTYPTQIGFVSVAIYGGDQTTPIYTTPTIGGQPEAIAHYSGSITLGSNSGACSIAPQFATGTQTVLTTETPYVAAMVATYTDRPASITVRHVASGEEISYVYDGIGNPAGGSDRLVYLASP